MTKATIVHEYYAERARRGVLRWILPLLGYPLQLWRYRGLVWNFFRRELLSRFRGSFFGVFWVLIQPLFLFALYYTVFGLLLGPRLKGSATEPDPEFAIYLFAGVIAWGAYVEGAGRACNVVIENGNLVKKVAFPCEILPVHVVLTAMLVYLAGAIVLLGFGLASGTAHPGLLMLAWPLVVLVHLVFTIGIGLFLANLQVFMRDTNQLLAIAHQALMFASGTFINSEQIDTALIRVTPNGRNPGGRFE